jgi:hypothetical protein
MAAAAARSRVRASRIGVVESEGARQGGGEERTMKRSAPRVLFCLRFACCRSFIFGAKFPKCPYPSREFLFLHPPLPFLRSIEALFLQNSKILQKFSSHRMF